MKFVLPLLAAIAACSAGVTEDPTSNYKEGDRFFYFPGDGDGILHLVDTKNPVDFNFTRELAENPYNYGYLLYTRKNPTVAQILRYVDSQSIFDSNFDHSKDTVFVAHGWHGNGNNYMSKVLTQAFLENGDVNVIVLDWSKLANRNYVTARFGVVAVGRALGQFAIWLTSFGLLYKKMHFVGFSLGGHVVGVAGKETRGRVGRITALDPAGPLFWPSSQNRVMSTDGQYVEVIHTNAGFLGYKHPCGVADFYPNGGSCMPGCFKPSCSHSRAYEYMASSVKNNHLNANECGSKNDAMKNKCSGLLYPMGNSNLRKSMDGIFRVNTGKDYPY